ncbi:MAG: molybdopterin molybdenumtransferase MoeA, partial [Planctomycetes bacterium]|nr:molybdopterin molybdenumtransferase MoeA [Planctomycetota bacterium]
ASDDREVLRAGIEKGLRSDMLCVTGGISMGAFDFVPEVLTSLGATFHIHKMAIKPGRPSIFATMPDGTPVFALPGNPISALVGFELLVRPALAAQQGRSGVLPRLVSATLKGSISAVRDRRTYVPARASVDDRGQWVAETLSWHGSGDALGVATANALIVRPPRADRAADGATVSIMLLDRL